MDEEDDNKILFIQWCAKEALDGMTVLSPWEELAYRRVLDLIYTTNDELLDDDKRMEWMTKTGRKWKAIKASLIRFNKIKIEERRIDGELVRFIVNEKCTRILAQARRNRDQKSGAGKSSSDKRKALKKKETASTAVDKSVVTADGTAEATNRKPLTKYSPHKPPKGGLAHSEFEQFWKAYRVTPNMPKKTTQQAWQRIIAADGPTPADLLRAVRLYNDWLDKQGVKAPTVCHATTFLNQGRYAGFLEQDTAPAPAITGPPLHPQPWKETVRVALGEAIYRSWISQLWLEGNTVLCPSRFARDWVAMHYGPAVIDAVGEGISFVVERPPDHAFEVAA